MRRLMHIAAEHVFVPAAGSPDGRLLRARPHGDHLRARQRRRLPSSSLAGHFLWWMPFRFLRGADLTVGASAGIFALIGALVYYGRRTGSSPVRTFITSNAGSGSSGAS